MNAPWVEKYPIQPHLVKTWSKAKKKKIFAKLTLFQIQKINLFRFLLYSPKDNMFTTQTINLQYTLPLKIIENIIQQNTRLNRTQCFNI